MGQKTTSRSESRRFGMIHSVGISNLAFQTRGSKIGKICINSLHRFFVCKHSNLLYKKVMKVFIDEWTVENASDEGARVFMFMSINKTS